MSSRLYIISAGRQGWVISINFQEVKGLLKDGMKLFSDGLGPNLCSNGDAFVTLFVMYLWKQFSLDGRLEGDNNRTGRSIKPFIIRKKKLSVFEHPRGPQG